MMQGIKFLHLAMLVLFFLVLPVALFLLPFGSCRRYRKVCKKHIDDAKECSLWASIVVALLCFLSYPISFIQFLIVGDPEDIDKRRELEKRRNAAPRIDAWILSWAVFTPTCLFLLGPLFGSFFDLVPMFRLFDMLYVLFWLLVVGKPSQKAGRSASFLLLHYLEGLMIFACFFLWVQSMSTLPIFADSQGKCLTLKPSSALYFSFITGATVGYGDIVPLTRVARVIVGLELFCVFYLVAIAVPRVFSFPTAEGQKTGAPKPPYR